MKRSLIVCLLLIICLCSGCKKKTTNSSSLISSSTMNDNSSSSSEELLTFGSLTWELYGEMNFIEKMANCNEIVPENPVYVSTSGSDSANGSINSPYLTINKAISEAAKNNKDVIVRGGTYTEDVTFSGSSGTRFDYLNVFAYTGENVYLNPKTDCNVDFADASYIVFKGFTICENIAVKDNIAVKINDGNTHIIFMNNTITNVKTTSPKTESCFLIYMNGESATASIDNILIYNNHLYDCATGWSEAIEVVANCEYINIIDNVINNTGNIGIDVGGNYGYCSDPSKDFARNVLVRGNDVSNCVSAYGDTSYGIYVDGGSYVSIENNKVYDCMGGIEVGAEEKNDTYRTNHVQVINNLIYNNTENGLTIGGYESTVGYVDTTIVEYNTIVNNGTSKKYCDNGQITLSYLDTVYIYNNIISTSNADGVLIGGFLEGKYVKNIMIRSNLFYSASDKENARFEIPGITTNGYSEFENKCGSNYYGDPSYINESFDINENSIAVSKGSWFYRDVLFDINYKERTNFTLGCYEK